PLLICNESEKPTTILTPVKGFSDSLQINSGGFGSTVSSDQITLNHQVGAQEGFDSLDYFWTNRFFITDKEMKITTSPYKSELQDDFRPIDSQSIFNANLSAVDNLNPNGIINTGTNRISFKYTSAPSKLEIIKIHRDGNYSPNGKDIDVITNIWNA